MLTAAWPEGTRDYSPRQPLQANAVASSHESAGAGKCYSGGPCSMGQGGRVHQQCGDPDVAGARGRQQRVAAALCGGVQRHAVLHAQ